MELTRNVTSTSIAVIVGFVTVVTLLGTFYYKRWKKFQVPIEWKKVGTVERIYLYPLKSGHRIELQKAECTEVGLKQVEDHQKVFQLRDRCLIVYCENDNEVRTAKTYPKMCLIKVSTDDKNNFVLNAPTMETIHVKIPNKSDKVLTSIKFFHKEKIPGLDCGDAVATWLSQYLIEKDSGLRLAFNDASTRRDITKTHKIFLDYYTNLEIESTGLFSDLTSLTLLNQKSVADMNKKIENSTITAENFRANIVVDGPNLGAYHEDQWDWIKIGDQVVLRNVKECPRCIITTVDPNNGTRHVAREPVRTLNSYRNCEGPEKGGLMGINVGVKKTGLLFLRDDVYVTLKMEKM